MGYPFPSAAWVEAVVAVLNQDERYARVASAWEGDIVFEVFPGPPGKDGQSADRIYLDLWHGKCRRGTYFQAGATGAPAAAFTMAGSRRHFLRIPFRGPDSITTT